MEFDTCGHCGAALRKGAWYCRFCWHAKCAVCSEWVGMEDGQAHMSGLHPEVGRAERQARKGRKHEDNSTQMSML